MATGLHYSVYIGKELIASTRYAEDAAFLSQTDAAVIKHGGRIVWKQVREDFRACDEVDRAASVMCERIRAHYDERMKRYAARMVAQ